jgi:hypothetical protein
VRREIHENNCTKWYLLICPIVEAFANYSQAIFYTTNARKEEAVLHLHNYFKPQIHAFDDLYPGRHIFGRHFIPAYIHSSRNRMNRRMYLESLQQHIFSDLFFYYGSSCGAQSFGSDDLSLQFYIQGLSLECFLLFGFFFILRTAAQHTLSEWTRLFGIRYGFMRIGRGLGKPSRIHARTSGINGRYDYALMRSPLGR